MLIKPKKRGTIKTAKKPFKEMSKRMTRDYRKQYKWNKENSMFIGVKLMKTTDADIIDYIDASVAAGETKQGCIKRCIRGEISRHQAYDQVAEKEPAYIIEKKEEGKG